MLGLGRREEENKRLGADVLRLQRQVQDLHSQNAQHDPRIREGILKAHRILVTAGILEVTHTQPEMILAGVKMLANNYKTLQDRLATATSSLERREESLRKIREIVDPGWMEDAR